MNPWLSFVGIGLGVAIGLWSQPAGIALGYVGDIYTRLLDLCIVPMLVTLVITSVAKLRDSRVGKRLARPLVIVVACAVLAAAAIPMLLGLAIDLGSRLSPSLLLALGRYVHVSSAALQMSLGAVQMQADPRPPLYALFLSFIPTNVFAAFENSVRSQLLVFALIFGLGLASSSERARRSVVEVLDIVFAGFRGIFRWLLVILPAGLACKIAHEVGEVSPVAFEGMWPFLALALALFLGLIAAAIWGLGFRARASAGLAARTMFRPMIVAFAANDGGAGAPAAVEGMRHLGFPPLSSDAMTPLTISFGKVAAIAYAAFAVAFAISPITSSWARARSSR